MRWIMGRRGRRGSYRGDGPSIRRVRPASQSPSSFGPGLEELGHAQVALDRAGLHAAGDLVQQGVEAVAQAHGLVEGPDLQLAAVAADGLQLRLQHRGDVDLLDVQDAGDRVPDRIAPQVGPGRRQATEPLDRGEGGGLVGGVTLERCRGQDGSWPELLGGPGHQRGAVGRRVGAQSGAVQAGEADPAGPDLPQPGQRLLLPALGEVRGEVSPHAPGPARQHQRPDTLVRPQDRQSARADDLVVRVRRDDQDDPGGQPGPPASGRCRGEGFIRAS